MESKETLYFAVAVTHDDIWVILSLPCSKSEAELFRGSELKNETFELKTLEEVKNYNKILI